jgi:DNA-binding MarR family transcriptional regulator
MNGNGKFEVDEFIRNLQLLSFLTHHYVEGRFISEATDKPLSFVHMNLLRILDQHPGRTVGDIARYMNVSYPAATKTIDKLVRLGLLRRREDTHDRRIAHLHLTPSGRNLVDKYVDLKRVQMEQIIDKFGLEKANELNRQMHNFAQNIVDLIPIKAGICIHCGAFSPEDCVATESEKTCGYLDASRKKYS